jgi:hypothetical protein
MKMKPNTPSGVESLPRVCGGCIHFSNAPAAIEAAFPGLGAMGSAQASVKACDGLCDRHGLYVPYRDCCVDFSPRAKDPEY